MIKLGTVYIRTANIIAVEKNGTHHSTGADFNVAVHTVSGSFSKTHIWEYGRPNEAADSYAFYLRQAGFIEDHQVGAFLIAEREADDFAVEQLSAKPAPVDFVNEQTVLEEGGLVVVIPELKPELGTDEIPLGPSENQ